MNGRRCQFDFCWERNVSECQNAFRNCPKTYEWYGKCHSINDYVERAPSAVRYTNYTRMSSPVSTVLIHEQSMADGGHHKHEHRAVIAFNCEFREFALTNFGGYTQPTGIITIKWKPISSQHCHSICVFQFSVRLFVWSCPLYGSIVLARIETPISINYI